jgi:UDP-2-acetamido-3-amino-2,3-dideoxy-glucuronate N-acetyltransferase
MGVRIAASADVSPEASIGEESAIWHLAQVREQAVLGSNCIVGRGAYVGTGVIMGDNCKLQNYALVYEPAGSGMAFSSAPRSALPTTTSHGRSPPMASSNAATTGRRSE